MLATHNIKQYLFYAETRFLRFVKTNFKQNNLNN